MTKTMKSLANPRKPRILLYDIETTPVLAWLWRPGFKINVSHEQIKKGQKFEIICIAYKWLGNRHVHALSWNMATQDSTAMIETFSKIVESADLVIGHNADSFDMKHINTQRLLHGQGPIAWPSSEDSLKQFRKYFAFPSYKLDYLAKTLVGAGKDKMVFQDWIDIVEGKSQRALNKMIRYCKKDVSHLEGVFKPALKFFAPKVNMSVVVSGNRLNCPRCGSAHVQGAGLCHRTVGTYRRFQCIACGHKYRSHKCEPKRGI